MLKLRKFRKTITIITSIIFFISVIVLTNDYFDDLQSKNTLLITLLVLQVIAIFNHVIPTKKET